MNLVALTGYVVKEPKSFATCTKFTLGVRRVGKEKTDYFSVTTFGSQKAFVDKYITIGRIVGVEGKLETSSYEKDGKKIYSVDVIGINIQALDKPKKLNMEIEDESVCEETNIECGKEE